MQPADPFVFRPPTPVTAPRHERIRAAEDACWHRLWRTVHPFTDSNVLCVGAMDRPQGKDFAEVNAAAQEFYGVIREVAPECVERASAELCVRLARMLCNEAMVSTSGGADQPRTNLNEAQMELRKARMLACAAIALADPAGLPPLPPGAPAA